MVAEELSLAPEQGRTIETELSQLKRELDNLLRLAADGQAPDSILSEIVKREKRVDELEHHLAACRFEEPSDLDQRRIKRALRGRLSKFCDLLHDDVPLARRALGKLLVGPIRFIPVDFKSWRVEGETQLGALLTPTSIRMASPTGFEPVSPP